MRYRAIQGHDRHDPIRRMCRVFAGRTNKMVGSLFSAECLPLPT